MPVEKYHLSRSIRRRDCWRRSYTGSLIDELEEEGELSCQSFSERRENISEPCSGAEGGRKTALVQVKMEKLKHKLEHIFSRAL